MNALLYLSDLWPLTFLYYQCHPMVWLCTAAPLWQRKERRRKSILILSLSSQSTPLCTSAITSSILRWELLPFLLEKINWTLCCFFWSLSLVIIWFILPSPLSQALTALLSDDSKFGFIVIDGSGALFGTLQGNTREVLHKFTVDLPKKHGTDPQYSQYLKRPGWFGQNIRS